MKNGWLEYEFPFGDPASIFRGKLAVSFREGTHPLVSTFFAAYIGLHLVLGLFFVEPFSEGIIMTNP